MPAMTDVRQQVITGVVPPQISEAVIRVAWPSVAAWPAVATLGRILTRTIIGAPLAWLIMAPIYFCKVLPFLGKRYTVTNRRVMIQRGLTAAPGAAVELSAIDDVRLQRDANSEFFRAATVEIISDGKVALTLPGVKEADSFRQTLLNACRAWAPGRIRDEFIPASAMSGKK